MPTSVSVTLPTGWQAPALSFRKLSRSLPPVTRHDRPPPPATPFPAPFTASFCSIRVSGGGGSARPPGDGGSPPVADWLEALLTRSSCKRTARLPAPTSLAAGPGPATVWVQETAQRVSRLPLYLLFGWKGSRGPEERAE